MPKAGPGRSLPTPATANTGQAKSRNRTHGGQGQQVPRLPVLPAETGHCSPGNTSRGRHAAQTPSAGGASTRSRLGNMSSRTAPSGRASRKLSGQPSSRRPGSSLAARGRDRTRIAELLADERSSQAVLDFLATDVGRTSGPAVVADEDGAASEASEWEAREQAEWEAREQAERLAEEEWLGVAA